MPELPDVAAFRKYFDKVALDRKISSAEVKNPKILRNASAGALEKRLSGDAFISSRQHGKYLFAGLRGGGWFLMHFGMTGYLESYEDPEREPKYSRLVIAFHDGGFLAYVNARMLGWVGLVDDPGELVRQKGLGPSALDGNFDFESFEKRLSGRTGGIKPALMDQEVVAGIGNVYSDEILFQARVHPLTGVDLLRGGQLKLIHEKIREVLRTAVERDAETARFPEGYLLRDRRKGALCPACGEKIQTLKVSGRTAYFCPQCQAGGGNKKTGRKLSPPAGQHESTESRSG